jgi:biopolymer transport protein TolQ
MTITNIDVLNQETGLTITPSYATFEIETMNIITLITDASLVVQLVLLILLFFSIFSWAIIFFKRRTVRAASSQSQKFLKVFRRSKNLTEVNEAAKKYQGSPLAGLFQSGFKEIAQLSRTTPQNPSNSPKLETLSRMLAKASNAEVTRLEKMMGFLATTGSVTPFIGLFGTVWGIMDAFQKIGIVRSASLVTVAPGIAEALIATAFGLFAAIPAVIAYNYFLHRIKELITEMEDFSLEFLNIAERLYGS